MKLKIFVIWFWRIKCTLLFETGSIDIDIKAEIKEDEPEYKIILKWRNIIGFFLMHTISIYALFNPPRLISTYLIQGALLIGIGFGTTVGSHRFFAD